VRNRETKSVICADSSLFFSCSLAPPLASTHLAAAARLHSPRRRCSPLVIRSRSPLVLGLYFVFGRHSSSVSALFVRRCSSLLVCRVFSGCMPFFFIYYIIILMFEGENGIKLEKEASRLILYESLSF